MTDKYAYSIAVDPHDPDTVICFNCALYSNEDHPLPRRYATIHIERHDNLTAYRKEFPNEVECQ